MSFTFDFHQVTQLRADIDREANTIMSKTSAVVKKGAVNIKRDWRSNAAQSAGAHASGYPSTINFDMSGQLEAEIGPNKAGQGNLGNLLEYGSVRNGPHDDGKRAAEAEGPKFEREIEKLSDRLLK